MSAADRRWLSAFLALPAGRRCRTGRPNADRRLTPREIQPRDLFHPTVILIAGVRRAVAGGAGHPDAGALAAQDLDAARAFGAPRAIGIALRTIALMPDQPRLDDLRASAEILENSEARLELARTLVELGAALRRGGARRAARDPLQRGLQLAHDCGAAPLAERARAELLATGARPRRAHTVGRDALTLSERRVAAMAKDGLANRGIAQALFLSPTTVEMHLGSTYRKLGISSRRQLAPALDQSESTGG
jgi:DNA-binding CsgD family transcriptional regulator